MANLGAARKKKAGTGSAVGALAKIKKGKTSSGVQRTRSLAALKARKKQPALARFKQRRRSPDDIIVSGILYHNPRVIDFRGDSPWGTVDVTNGNTTYRLTNQAGSWMYPIPDHKGYYKEPAALKLGSQVEVCTNLNVRFERYLKAEGILTAAQKRAQREIQEKEARKVKNAAKSGSKPKLSLAALKARKGRS